MVSAVRDDTRASTGNEERCEVVDKPKQRRAAVVMKCDFRLVR
jgi:hypothetical protein